MPAARRWSRQVCPMDNKTPQTFEDLRAVCLRHHLYSATPSLPLTPTKVQSKLVLDTLRAQGKAQDSQRREELGRSHDSQPRPAQLLHDDIGNVVIGDR